MSVLRIIMLTVNSEPSALSGRLVAFPRFLNAAVFALRYNSANTPGCLHVRANKADDRLSIKKKPGDYARPIMIVVAVLVIGVSLVVCLVGAAILGTIVANSNRPPPSCPDRGVASSTSPDGKSTAYTHSRMTALCVKCPWMLRPAQCFRRQLGVRNGEVHITWNRGGHEVATVHWLNNNTMDYRIVDHTDVVQIGIGTTFQRQ